jgi:hypothetical protein
VKRRYRKVAVELAPIEWIVTDSYIGHIRACAGGVPLGSKPQIGAGPSIW